MIKNQSLVCQSLLFSSIYLVKALSNLKVLNRVLFLDIMNYLSEFTHHRSHTLIRSLCLPYQIIAFNIFVWTVKSAPLSAWAWEFATNHLECTHCPIRGKRTFMRSGIVSQDCLISGEYAMTNAGRLKLGAKISVVLASLFRPLPPRSQNELWIELLIYVTH